MPDPLWISDLTHEDLQRLRSAVRRVYAAKMGAAEYQLAYPQGMPDNECDKIIESIAPDAWQQYIKAMVDLQVDTESVRT